CSTEAALAHAATYPSRREIYSAGFGGFLQSGRDAPALAYGAAAILRREFRGAMEAVFQEVDLLISPVTPWLVPSVADFHALCEDAAGLEELIKVTCIYDLSRS